MPVASTGKVLVLEDDVLINLDYSLQLEDLGYEVVSCHTIEDAVTAIENGDFHFAFVDHRVRDRTSEAVRELLQTEDVPFFILTGSGKSEFGEPEREKILQKPVCGQMLSRCVDKLASLRRRRTRGGYAAAC